MPHKGYDVLVEAARRVQGRDTGAAGFEVVVAGEGPERRRLEQAARGTPVRFVGPVEDPTAFLRELDAFVLSSRDEGLPLALLEAMAAGLPCLATDVGDVREALGGVGLVVPHGDADALADGLAALVRDEAGRRTWGSQARSRVADHYSATATSRSTAAVYDAVLRTTGSGRRRYGDA